MRAVSSIPLLVALFSITMVPIISAQQGSTELDAFADESLMPSEESTEEEAHIPAETEPFCKAEECQPCHISLLAERTSDCDITGYHRKLNCQHQTPNGTVTETTYQSCSSGGELSWMAAFQVLNVVVLLGSLAIIKGRKQMWHNGAYARVSTQALDSV